MTEATSATQDVFRVMRDTMNKSQMAVKTSINAYREGSGRVLGKYDEYFAKYVVKRPYGMLELSSALQGDLIGAETEVTSRIYELANKVADKADEATHKLAAKTTERISKFGEVVDKFEEVFDTRVLHSLGRISMPAVRVAQELAGQLADVSEMIEDKVGKAEHKAVATGRPRKAATASTSKRKRKGKTAA